MYDEFYTKSALLLSIFSDYNGLCRSPVLNHSWYPSESTKHVVISAGRVRVIVLILGRLRLLDGHALSIWASLDIGCDGRTSWASIPQRVSSILRARQNELLPRRGSVGGRGIGKFGSLILLLCGFGGANWVCLELPQRLSQNLGSSDTRGIDDQSWPAFAKGDDNIEVTEWNTTVSHSLVSSNPVASVESAAALQPWTSIS